MQSSPCAAANSAVALRISGNAAPIKVRKPHDLHFSNLARARPPDAQKGRFSYVGKNLQTQSPMLQTGGRTRSLVEKARQTTRLSENERDKKTKLERYLAWRVSRVTGQ